MVASSVLSSFSLWQTATAQEPHACSSLGGKEELGGREAQWLDRWLGSVAAWGSTFAPCRKAPLETISSVIPSSTPAQAECLPCCTNNYHLNGLCCWGSRGQRKPWCLCREGALHQARRLLGAGCSDDMDQGGGGIEGLREAAQLWV